MSIRFLHDTDADGEVKGTSLEITGNANISGTTTVIAPTANLHAATKAYVDGAVIANTDTQDLSIVGTTLSLTNSPDVTIPQRAVSDSNTSTSTTTAASSAAVKSARDTANSAGLLAIAALSKGGGIMTGKITLDGAPSSNLHAATKAYVDSAVIADTDTQDITQSGNTFTLERGGSVDVSTTTAVAANSLKLGMVLANSVTSTSTIQAGSANATRLAYNNVSTSTLQTRLAQINTGNITLGVGAVPIIATGSLTTNGALYAGFSKIGLRDLDWDGANTENAMASVQGDVINQPDGVSTVAGKIYMLTSTGGLTLADADTVNTSTGLLVVAVGTTSGKGLLLRGVLRLPTNPDASPGQPIYLNADGESVPSGTATASAPTAGIVRVLGYQLTNSEGTSSIYFNPDNTWVELTA